MQIIETEKTDLWTDAVTLEGRRLRLEPLGLNHLDDLEKNLLSPQAWHGVHWGTRTRVDLEKGLTSSLRVRKEKSGNGFAFVLKDSGEAVGMSRLMAFNRKRDYKVYSIIDSEWPNVKKTLNWYLDKYV